MSTAFAITPTLLAVELDAERKGNASFNVTNTTPDLLRARAEVRTSDAAHASWYEVEQPQEGLLLEPGTTTKVRVRIAAPLEAAAGRENFRLLVYSIEKPGELFAESSAVAVTVPERAPEPKKPFPWWIVILAAAILLIVIIGLYFLLRDTGPSLANEGSYGQVSLSDFQLGEDGGNVVRVAPGARVQGSTHYVYDCPNCQSGSINQVILGLEGADRAQQCIYNGRIQGEGDADFTLTAPSEPGTYFVRFRYAQAFDCPRALGWWTVDGAPTEDANIGAIVVHD